MIQKGGEGENINIDYGHLPEEVLLWKDKERETVGEGNVVHISTTVKRSKEKVVMEDVFEKQLMDGEKTWDTRRVWTWIVEGILD